MLGVWVHSLSRVAGHQPSQHPLKGLGTDKTVEAA